MRREILKDLTGMIELYETFYLAPKEVEAIKGSPLTKARYAKFEEWLKTVYEKGVLPDPAIEEMQLLNDTDFAVRLYEALRQIALDQPLHPDIQRSYEPPILAPDEFFLKRKDIPDWDELPSKEKIEADFLLDSILDIEYRQGRKLRDPADHLLTTEETFKNRKGFEPIDLDLCHVFYGMDDPAKRKAFLTVDRSLLSKRLLPGRIFDIKKIIKQKRAQDPSRSAELTTRELLEAFDRADVRPATLEELLAYSRVHWVPKLDPDNPLTDLQFLQNADVARICALGSIFSDSFKRRCIPCLIWTSGKRELDSAPFDQTWDDIDHFLVFRKIKS